MRIIAVMNQKGGTGKTTTVVNLGSALAQGGARVLLVDLDVQGNLGVSFGIEGERGLYHILVDGVDPNACAVSVRHALEAAKAVNFPIQTFGGTKNFLPQALAIWEGRAEADAATREADARIDEQLRREREELERRQRLADMRASLSDDALATLKRRAEEALATDGGARMRLGYEVLVKLKVDEFLERECLPTDVSNERGKAASAAT
jgi:cellulose biosynthesis protein BcsQ